MYNQIPFPYADYVLSVCKNKLWSEEGKMAHQFLTSLGLSESAIRGASIGYNPSKFLLPPSRVGSDTDTVLLFPKGIIFPVVRESMWDSSVIIESNLDDFVVMDPELPVSHRSVCDHSAFYNAMRFNFHENRQVNILTSNVVDTLILQQELGDNFAVINYHSTYRDKSYYDALSKLLPEGIILTTVSGFSSIDLADFGNIVPLELPTVANKKLQYVYEIPKAGLNIQNWFGEQIDKLGLGPLLEFDILSRYRIKGAEDDTTPF